jgi:hypothetical protein
MGSSAEELIRSIRTRLLKGSHAQAQQVRTAGVQLDAIVGELNERVEQIEALLDANEYADAMELARLDPPLLETVLLVEFPERPEWDALCHRLELPTPQTLDRGRIVTLRERLAKAGMKLPRPVAWEPLAGNTASGMTGMSKVAVAAALLVVIGGLIWLLIPSSNTKDDPRKKMANAADTKPATEKAVNAANASAAAPSSKDGKYPEQTGQKKEDQPATQSGPPGNQDMPGEPPVLEVEVVADGEGVIWPKAPGLYDLKDTAKTWRTERVLGESFDDRLSTEQLRWRLLFDNTPVIQVELLGGRLYARPCTGSTVAGETESREVLIGRQTLIEYSQALPYPFAVTKGEHVMARIQLLSKGQRKAESLIAVAQKKVDELRSLKQQIQDVIAVERTARKSSDEFDLIDGPRVQAAKGKKIGQLTKEETRAIHQERELKAYLAGAEKRTRDVEAQVREQLNGADLTQLLAKAEKELDEAKKAALDRSGLQVTAIEESKTGDKDLEKIESEALSEEQRNSEYRTEGLKLVSKLKNAYPTALDDYRKIQGPVLRQRADVGTAAEKIRGLEIRLTNLSKIMRKLSYEDPQRAKFASEENRIRNLLANMERSGDMIELRGYTIEANTEWRYVARNLWLQPLTGNEELQERYQRTGERLAQIHQALLGASVDYPEQLDEIKALIDPGTALLNIKDTQQNRSSGTGERSVRRRY